MENDVTVVVEEQQVETVEEQQTVPAEPETPWVPESEDDAIVIVPFTDSGYHDRDANTKVWVRSVDVSDGKTTVLCRTQGCGGSQKWIDLQNLRPAPKEGDAFYEVFRNTNYGRVVEGYQAV